ncbi:hypothetical protein K0M31_004686 [Melipona bicolor]|uniref:Uncharacterized protein n=1 Tax=Melipona bicolor TaxID=60889 RepID=A0AA40FXE0_9HYME|nr:hypothetical protein K0M31_004686 [Melipona bicolor]
MRTTKVNCLGADKYTVVVLDVEGRFVKIYHHVFVVNFTKGHPVLYILWPSVQENEINFSPLRRDQPTCYQHSIFPRGSLLSARVIDIETPRDLFLRSRRRKGEEDEEDEEKEEEEEEEKKGFIDDNLWRRRAIGRTARNGNFSDTSLLVSQRLARLGTGVLLALGPEQRVASQIERRNAKEEDEEDEEEEEEEEEHEVEEEENIEREEALAVVGGNRGVDRELRGILG